MDTAIDYEVAAIEAQLDAVVVMINAVTADLAKKQAFVAQTKQAIDALKQ
jgi:hypothetical protein